MLGALAALSALLLGDVVIRGSLAQAVLIAPWLLAGLWGAYLAWFASRITTDENAITVHNLLRRTRVPWGRVAGIELRWQVEVALDDGSVVRSFGGPALARRGMLRTRTAPDGPTEQTGRIVDDWIAAEGASGGEVQRAWDEPALVALAAIVVWLAVAVSWPLLESAR